MTTFLAHAADEKVRRMASSGGFTKALLVHLLETGRVDAVVIAKSGDGEKFAPGFIVTSDPADILRPQTNSVYYPISPREAIIHLDPTKRYAATLLPCDVAWLERMKHAGNFRCVEFVIALMCNATPNAEWTAKVAAKLGKSGEVLRDVRYRGEGWPGKTVIHNGSPSEPVPFPSLWADPPVSAHLCEKCKNCRYDGLAGADLMVADPWHVHGRNFGDGETMVHAVTELGVEVVNEATGSGCIVTEPIEDGPFYRQLAELQSIKRVRRFGVTRPITPSGKPRDGKQLRVGFITPALYWGGAERWMLDLARLSQDRLDWQGVACVTQQFRDKTMAGLFETMMPVVESGRDAVQQVAATSDILVAWGSYDLESMVYGYDGPVVFVGHGQGQFDRNAVRNCYRGATNYACVAEAALEPFDGYVPRERVQVIHNGIDPNRCRQTIGREKIREQLGVAEDEFLVGYIGRLAPEKNPVGVAQAVAMLPKRFRAMFVGGGSDMDRQRAMIHEIIGARAIFVDRTEQVGNYYRAMDTFALLSPREGFSMGMLEAMYCGTPCVLTNVGVLPELEKLVGRHWERVPSDNHCARLAAEAIARLAAMPQRKRAGLVDDCKKIVEERFLASHMATRWVEHLKQIVSAYKPKEQLA